jgi:hypothetical protein
MPGRFNRRSAALLSAASAALSTIVSPQHLAADIWTYIGPQNAGWRGSANWYDTNINSNGVPGPSDSSAQVYISNLTTSPTLGAHVNLNTDATIDALTVDNDGSISFAEVDQSAKTLTAESEDIGLAVIQEAGVSVFFNSAQVGGSTRSDDCSLGISGGTLSVGRSLSIATAHFP